MRAIALLVALAACQPMYDAPAAPLHPLERHPRPTTAVAGDPAVTYVEDCEVDFRRPPRAIAPTSNETGKRVDAGDTKLQAADQAADAKAKVELVKQGIGEYSRALVDAPYDADATLKLALAYDRVLRKGCALAMLKRLAALANHPKLAQPARADMDRVADNTQWFKGYRKAALTAIGY